MKPKRVILVVDYPAAAPVHRVVLETHGFRVLICETELQCQQTLAKQPIDLVLIGPTVPFDELAQSNLPLPNLRMSSGMYVRDLVERIRVLLIRKRGPKAPQSVSQVPEVRKAIA